MERLKLGGKGTLALRGSQTPKILSDRRDMSKSTQMFITFCLELSHRVCDLIDNEVLIPTREVLTVAKKVTLPLS